MKFAICQELFEDWSWDDQCRAIANIGYTGLEVAPFTLAASPRQISATDRQRLRKTAEDHGLSIIGLHWLLAKTSGLHLTADDPAIRLATADYLSELADLCADLGGDVMVFGSPAQRNLREGLSLEEGMERAAEVFRAAMPRLQDRGVTLCLEPLTTKETNFLNTCEQAVELIRRVDQSPSVLHHPSIALHQDVKAMLGEGVSLPGLIRKYAPLTRHFHVNDSNLLGPGMGPTDYAPICRALKETGYSGWISVEVFDYSPGAERIARESLDYLNRMFGEVDR
jgi:sugar phosphate isomerase/epimerase